MRPPCSRWMLFVPLLYGPLLCAALSGCGRDRDAVESASEELAEATADAADWPRPIDDAELGESLYETKPSRRQLNESAPADEMSLSALESTPQPAAAPAEGAAGVKIDLLQNVDESQLDVAGSAQPEASQPQSRGLMLGAGVKTDSPAPATASTPSARRVEGARYFVENPNAPAAAPVGSQPGALANPKTEPASPDPR